jgi:hypothetical protein
MTRYLVDTDTEEVTVLAGDDDVTYLALIAEKQAPNATGQVFPKYEETGLTDPRVTPSVPAKLAITRAAAYTKTYAVAARVIPVATVAAVVTTSSALAAYGFTEAQADAIPVAINALAADVLALRKLLVAVVEDLEASGISG